MTNRSQEYPLLGRLAAIRVRAKAFFREAISLEPPDTKMHSYDFDYWEELEEPQRKTSREISAELAVLAHNVGVAIRRSPLLTEADELEAGHAIKGMRAALRFRRFSYEPTEVLHDEGTVLGVRRATESTQVMARPSVASHYFETWGDTLQLRLELVSPEAETIPDSTPETSSRQIAAGVRPGTAFIMMWMSNDHPELDDVSNAIKRCCSEFNINAIRSDDIQHADVITQRILDQIKTAEFLFADLTGERPSVYYEVGYAHAIGRRVHLFRKKGSPIHFDVAGYNCPEYLNLSDLERQLKKRLEHLTSTIEKEEE